MLTRLLRSVLPSLVACTFGLQAAHADIYTWVDGSGRVNLSNLTPPEGVRVTRVTHETAPKVAATDSAPDAARQAEMQALADRAKDLEMQLLSERVRQLEREVELSQSQAPPPTEYASMPAAPVVQYIVEAPAPPPSSYGCDPSWFGCGFWWGSGIYPASVVVLGAPNFRRFHHPVRLGQPLSLPRPLRPPGVAPRVPHRR